MDWVSAVTAFVGAAVGSALTYGAARRDLLQREGAGRREEWGRRFTSALDDLAGDSFRRRELGRAVLVHFAASSLATTEEQQLAKVVLARGALIDAEGEDLGVVRRSVIVDNVRYVHEDRDETTRTPGQEVATDEG